MKPRPKFREGGVRQADVLELVLMEEVLEGIEKEVERQHNKIRKLIVAGAAVEPGRYRVAIKNDRLVIR
jgi:hypothetical protein